MARRRRQPGEGAVALELSVMGSAKKPAGPPLPPRGPHRPEDGSPASEQCFALFTGLSEERTVACLPELPTFSVVAGSSIGGEAPTGTRLTCQVDVPPLTLIAPASTLTEGPVMAKRFTESLIDDIDASAAATTVRFAVDGAEYEINLSEKNAEEFHEVMAPYISAARRAGGGRQSRGSARSAGRSSASSNGSSSPDPKEVRAWAESNGIEVSKRGRIASSLVVKFQEARG